MSRAELEPLPRTGVVIMPMIFGRSHSFDAHVADLADREYVTDTVDLYQGQQFDQPSFFRLSGPNERGKLNRLITSFDDDIVLSNVKRTLKDLVSIRGVERIFVVGFGLGGVYALQTAEQLGGLSGVAAWHPRLKYTPGVSKSPADLTRLNCPALLFYGEKDHKVGPQTIEIAKEAARTIPSVAVEVYPRVTHAFADYTVQGIIPNYLYCLNPVNWPAAKASWNKLLEWMPQQK